MFGLAQLYQLRGRVGRAKERAYCYLIVPPPSAMTDEARARIEALERHTELGSGFQIASLDLELRGAGDLLGAEQSGIVASVGFELFCQMLEEAAHELRGEPVVHEVDPELSFDVEALLPEDYVADVGVRLSLYKRLAERRATTPRSTSSPSRWRTASARRRSRRKQLVELMRAQDRAAQAARARLRGDAPRASPCTCATTRRSIRKGRRARRDQEVALSAVARRPPHAPRARDRSAVERPGARRHDAGRAVEVLERQLSRGALALHGYVNV